MYDSLWAHPDFYFQNDNLFSKISVSYERIHNSDFYDIEISNHETRNRARVFLAPRLKEPKITELFVGGSDEK